jgi:hypothetical protein
VIENSQYKSEGFLIAYVKFVATTLGFTDTHRLLFLSGYAYPNEIQISP